MKKAISVLMAMALVFCLFACGKETTTVQETTQPLPEATGPLVGISLPVESEFWKSVAYRVESQLRALNYRTQTQYAENDPQKQNQQLKAMAESQIGCLVVTPVDTLALSEGLAAVKNAGIPVVAFDRLPLGTMYVDALVSFDYMDMGRLMGEHIVKTKSLETAEYQNRRYSIEFFMGSAADNTALQFHAGLMSVLQPYIDADVLQCHSGRTSFEDTYVLLAAPENAAQKLESLLQDFYSKRSLDILCFATDDMAAGCKDLLATYAEGKTLKPMVLGVGGTLSGVQQIIDGVQAATFYQDYEAMAVSCAQTVDTLVSLCGVTADTTTNNQMIDVPTLTNPVQMVDKSNYQAVLMDTGVYSWDDLTLPE